MSAANRGQRYPADTLPADQIRRLIKAEKGRSSSALRNRALIATTWRGALRIGEALSLTPSDIDLNSGRIRIRKGKGERPRTVYMDDDALAQLEPWIERRSALGLNGRHPIFSTLKGGKLHPNHARRLLRRLADRAGIEARVHPHLLRHSRAAELAAEGVPVNVIQKALGHRSLATTSRYLDHVAPTDVERAMRGAGSRG
jgi:integrase